MRTVARTVAFAALGCAVATAASAEVRRVGPVIVYTAPAQTAQAATIDFANAREMPLPTTRRAPRSQAEALRLGARLAAGKPGFSPGREGSGERKRVVLPKSHGSASGDEVQPSEFGTSNHPFSTARVGHEVFTQIPLFYPKRAAGKLFFNIGSGTYVCSASLIGPGIVVTAAHCVASFGDSTFYTNWVFVPAYNLGVAFYGTWTTSNAFVLASYFNGTGSCAVSGIVCQDDVAVLVQNPQDGAYPGTATGFYGYGFDGYGFNAAGQVLVNQLGYPVALDSGELMQRNDSQGFVDPTSSNNTIIGSLLTGGSSGGPWLVNLGDVPTLNGTQFGSEATHNVVVGVTSWGYVDTRVKEQGASPFTTGNIVALVTQACTTVPAAC